MEGGPFNDRVAEDGLVDHQGPVVLLGPHLLVDDATGVRKDAAALGDRRQGKDAAQVRCCIFVFFGKSQERWRDEEQPLTQRLGLEVPMDDADDHGGIVAEERCETPLMLAAAIDVAKDRCVDDKFREDGGGARVLRLRSVDGEKAKATGGARCGPVPHFIGRLH